ncbi:hypothetical protein IG631_11891 [Alternaria alternata]|nr:hypothetical protein IG631_11891 [Alternaria alternata]
MVPLYCRVLVDVECTAAAFHVSHCASGQLPGFEPHEIETRSIINRARRNATLPSGAAHPHLIAA